MSFPVARKGKFIIEVRLRTMGPVPVSEHSGTRRVALQKYILGLDLLPGPWLRLLDRAGRGALCGTPNPFQSCCCTLVVLGAFWEVGSVPEQGMCVLPAGSVSLCRISVWLRDCRALHCLGSS